MESRTDATPRRCTTVQVNCNELWPLSRAFRNADSLIVSAHLIPSTRQGTTPRFAACSPVLYLKYGIKRNSTEIIRNRGVRLGALHTDVQQSMSTKEGATHFSFHSPPSFQGFPPWLRQVD